MSDIFELFEKIKKPEPTQAAGNPVVQMLVGLGNPGEKYAFTRHNTGFLAMDYIAQKLNAKIERIKFKSLCGEASIDGRRTLLLKTQTYMNLSGEAVREAAEFYRIPPEKILVLCDDINFDVGEMRIKRSGSSGGQNGMKNIILQLNTDQIPRIKVGIGHKPSPEYDLKDFVLSKYSPTEQKVLFSTFEKIYDAVKLTFSGEIDKAMNLYNR